jgi:N5-(carboxyethyl)ornithine synthase
MQIGFVRPNYPDETRVAIKPDGVAKLSKQGIKIVLESGFGQSMNIGDHHYAEAGAQICSRQECYEERIVFNLKLTQPSDYTYLRPDHILVGWTHPFGSGEKFYQDIVSKKGITLIDIDSVMPRIFRGSADPENADFFPPHMFWKNSYNAGIASVRLALKHLQIKGSPEKSVCVLGSGSVAQGAFYELSRHGFVPRMFYRNTLSIFDDLLGEFDIIANGIEVDRSGLHIMDMRALEQTREDVCIIEAAADAGNAIYGTEYQSLDKPVGSTVGRKYTMVNNAPTIMTDEASRDVAAVVGNDILPALSRNIGKIT